MKAEIAIALVAAMCVATGSAAQEEIRLWPNGAPGSEGKSGAEKPVANADGLRRVASVHHPSILVYLPSKETATGAGVIVMPGGGHRHLSIENEGTAVAQWLSERGIAGFVLKYRLAREEGSTYTVEEHAVADAQRAIRVVRGRAREWNVDPDRVGVMGFSAGGQLAFNTATRFDTGRTDATDPVERESSRPAFHALIYSGSLDASADHRWSARRILKIRGVEMPPAFLVVALDDKTPARTSVELVQELQAVGASAELHLYAAGGHGFGMKNRPLPITTWPARFQEWMADRGFLNHAPTSR